MFRSARTTSLVLFVAALIVSKTPPVFAADYVRCAADSSCVIGEFLFDDEYTPIATASCKLTSTNPSGSVILNNTVMTPHGDGWYDHAVDTTGLAAGLYRSQICCTIIDYDERLCIDKSFTVNLPDLSSTDIANAVWEASGSDHTNPGSLGQIVQSPPDPADIWNYENRSLTSYGSLVYDIWNYTARSLTSFGTLVSSIWTHNNRTLTSQNLDSGSLATQTDVNSSGNAIRTDNITNTDYLKNLVNFRSDQLKDQITAIRATVATLSASPITPQNQDMLNKIYAQVLQNRDLLDALVNEPIVQTSIDDNGPPPDLQSKIDQTKATSADLFVTTQQIVSRLGVLNLKLAQLPVASLNTELITISSLINNPSKNETSITGQLAWLEKAWGSKVTGDLSQAAGETLSAIKMAQSNLLGASTIDGARDHLVTASEAGDRLAKLIGDVSNTSIDSSLYGYVAKVQFLAEKLNQNDQAISDLLTKWNSVAPLNKQKELTTLENNVLTVNQLSNARSLINTPSDSPESGQKNKLLSLKAITNINRLLLAKMAGEPFSNIWLEEGSVIFRALIINPSERISQKVPLKYYLPAEVKEEDIIKYDPELTVKFDSNQNAVYVTGEFELAPGESRTTMVEVTDIFKISPETINSLRGQAEELLKPLQKTSFFGQGATLKSDIDVMLDKILDRQSSAQTPESRIRAYRENQIEFAGAKQKLDQLKTILADSGSTNSIFGFVGGIQSVALWGIVIIVIAGFVFLSIYLKILRKEAYAAAGYHPVSGSAGYDAQTQHGWPLDLIKRYTDRLSRLKDLPSAGWRIDPGTRFFQILFIIMATCVLTVIIITTIIYNPTAKQSTLKSPLSQIPAEAKSNPIKTLNLSEGTKLYTAPDITSRVLSTLQQSTSAKPLQSQGNFLLVELPAAFSPSHGWVTR